MGIPCSNDQKVNIQLCVFLYTLRWLFIPPQIKCAYATEIILAIFNVHFLSKVDTFRVLFHKYSPMLNITTKEVKLSRLQRTCYDYNHNYITTFPLEAAFLCSWLIPC